MIDPLNHDDSVAMGSARALACGGRRPRRPQGRLRTSHRLVIGWGLRSDRRGAGRHTRGRVCSPIPTDEPPARPRRVQRRKERRASRPSLSSTVQGEPRCAWRTLWDHEPNGAGGVAPASWSAPALRRFGLVRGKRQRAAALQNLAVHRKSPFHSDTPWGHELVRVAGRDSVEPWNSGRQESQGPTESRPTQVHGKAAGAYRQAWVHWFVCLCFILARPVRGELAWQSGDGYRSAPLDVPATGRPGFTELSPQTTDLTFTNRLAKETAGANQILLNGSGVAAGDVDGDGRCDLYFCGLETPNALYRNLGNWKFEDITAAAGVACPGQHSTGAVLGDVDGDGDLDLLVNSVGGGTRLFLNDGQGRFQEATSAGLIRRFGSTSLALADLDGDGDLDLYVANYRTTTVRSTGFDLLNLNGRRMIKPEDRDRLYITEDGFIREHGEVDVVYLNDGKGHFQPLSWTDGRFREEDGTALANPPRDWALSVMMRDLNGDGAPDIYVCNDFWSPDRIWINDGQGHFRALGRTALANTSTFSMAMDFADLNRDGFDDFMVLDMFSPDHVRRMTQTMMFGLLPWPIGYPAERPQVTRNTLFLNRGDLTFAEIAQMSGVDATDWSWCPIFLDVDLDGYEDLLVATGNLFDTQDQDAEARINAMGPWPRQKLPQKLLQYPPLLLPKAAFRNRGDLTFEDVSSAWGFDRIGVSHGMCLADLDQDGDLDVVANQLNAAAGLYRNNSAAPRLAIRLKGAPPNFQGIGARLRVFDGPVPLQSQQIIAGGRYLSSDEPMRVFAVGRPPARLKIEVNWRSGRRTVITNVEPNRIFEITEPTSTAAPPTQLTALSADQSGVESNSPPIFEDVSRLLQHSHHQEAFDDFARQPLLPNKLSQPGPGVSWFDLDGDGWDDLIIGAARGGSMAVYRNDHQGGFALRHEPVLGRPITRDQTTVLGWRAPDGRARLLVGSSNYEDGLPIGASVRQFDLQKNSIDDGIPGLPSTTGPLAMADVDGDGDLDLFVGGRVLPGRYPEPASSRLFRNDQGVFRLDVENSKKLENAGLVNGAVFSDLHGDGLPELILAGDWGSLQIFRNDRGALTPWNPSIQQIDRPLLNPQSSTRDAQSLTSNVQRSTFNVQRSTLSELTGWWNGVATGDFDGDGRMDIVASNWGRNTKYERHRREPLRLYSGDLNGAGGVDLVEAHFDQKLGKTVPERAFVSMANALPFIRERFSTHQAYAQASLAEILGDRLKAARERTVNTLESILLLNRGDHFEIRTLPAEAQFAPAFGLAVGDLDGDGNEDVFLSQNFFATQPATSPYDGGRGLWLRGDGRGGLTPVPGQMSGIKIYGEQRGCALSDYDRDGRIDLVVGQNGGETKLFHNVTAKAGWRIRLQGPSGNPNGVGAVVRFQFGDTLGPAREIQAGSGYGSQASAVPVLGAAKTPTHLQVGWPGGKVTVSPVPAQARELTVAPQP